MLSQNIRKNQQSSRITRIIVVRDGYRLSRIYEQRGSNQSERRKVLREVARAGVWYLIHPGGFERRFGGRLQFSHQDTVVRAYISGARYYRGVDFIVNIYEGGWFSWFLASSSSTRHRRRPRLAATADDPAAIDSFAFPHSNYYPPPSSPSRLAARVRSRAEPTRKINKIRNGN